MTVSLYYRELTGVLHMKYVGAGDAPSRFALVEELLEQMRTNDVNKIMIDARETVFKTPLLTLNTYGKRLAAASEFSNSKIAMICNSFDEDNEYVALVAKNLGARIQTFNDSVSAEKWLES